MLFRFECWCNAVQFVDVQHFLENDLPPVDVIMVWHAYLLNPRSVPPTEPLRLVLLNPSHILSWYAEDTTRVRALGALGNLTLFFTTTMVTVDLQLHHAFFGSHV